MRSPAAERRTRLKAAAVLAAALLWLSTGRCDGFESARTARCDTGKEHLDRDLPVGGFYCKQPGSAGRALAQTLQAVDKVHQAEAAAEICMDQTISYQQGLPHSGVFRPVAAESGEYLYCPPQRWLNNLHRAAIVLLYHPCAAADERRLLSALARSCLPHHIVSSHPQLSTPVALVSWGRTLELPTATSAELCHWLEATLLTGQKPGGASAGRKYNLLLTRPAEQQQQQESVRSCCERTRSEHRMKTQQEQQQSRRRRAASSPEKTGNTTSTSGAPGTRTRTQTLPRPPIDQTPPPRPATTPPGSGASAPTPPGSHTAPALTLELDESDRSDDSSLKEVKQKERQSRSPAPPAAATGVTQPTEGAEEVRVGAVQVPGGVEEVAGGAKEVPGVEEVPGGAADVAGGAKVPPPRTPRSDEAVWAAAALGFLLVLLTLSVLHTRLYRHWRRAPSLYWHHPLDHYDSVADVIRRRLHLAKRRRRRSRRQEAVLLPSSSSSDELP